MKIEEERTARRLRRAGEFGESFCVFWTRLWEFNAGTEGKENRARKRERRVAKRKRQEWRSGLRELWTSLPAGCRRYGG